MVDTSEISQARMESIAFTPMSPRLRNELITQAYGDIADEMAEVLGHENATWCSIGQWASNSIGDYLGLPVPSLGRLITRAFADGNRDVFADVGRAHVTFLETVGYAARHGDDLDEAWLRCQDELRVELPEPPSQPLPAPATTAGTLTDGRVKLPGSHRRELLIRGFRAYREAIDEADDDTKARLILLGNSLIALHEQKQLGPAISAGFRTWLRHLTTFWRPWQTTYRWRNSDPHDWRLRLEGWWIRTATKRFVRVELPDKTISTGAPLAPTDHRVVVPPSLKGFTPAMATLDDIPSLLLLSIVFEAFDVDGRAATCWADLEDRMAFILAMFANEQRSPAMIDPVGRLRRPVRRPHLVDDRQRLEARVEHLLPAPREPASAILEEATLDELRLSTVDQLSKAALATTHQGVHHVEGAHDTTDFRADFDVRVATVCGPGRLLDPATVATARRVFDEWSTLMYMGLLFRSLPDGYAARRGVKVLGTVSDLATNPVRRVGETAQFLDDLFVRTGSWNGDGLVPDGPACQSLRGVRVIHALISQQLLERGWDHDDLGVPINHEDVLGTMLSFFVPPFEMLDELGIDLPESDRNAFTRFWCGIGHVMGLPLDVVTVGDAEERRAMTFSEARALSQLIRSRHHERSIDGVRLGEALVEGVADGFPRFSDWVAIGLFHVLGSRDVNDLLLLSERRGRRRAAAVAGVLGFSLRWRLTRPPTREFVQLAGRFWLQPFLDEGAARPFRRLANGNPEAGAVAPPLQRSIDRWPLGCG